MNKVYNKQY